LGYRPPDDASAEGNVLGTHPNAGVPVRVGVPLAATAAADALLPELICEPIPATVSTLPLIPEGSSGVSTGNATLAPEPVLYTFHLVPNSFWALPTLIVALTRRWVTSTVAVTPLDLNAFTTPLRFADDAPYLLASVDSDGYLP
jgi:hypothetical protein